MNKYDSHKNTFSYTAMFDDLSICVSYLQLFDITDEKGSQEIRFQGNQIRMVFLCDLPIKTADQSVFHSLLSCIIDCTISKLILNNLHSYKYPVDSGRPECNIILNKVLQRGNSHKY